MWRGLWHRRQWRRPMVSADVPPPSDRAPGDRADGAALDWGATESSARRTPDPSQAGRDRGGGRCFYAIRRGRPTSTDVNRRRPSSCRLPPASRASGATKVRRRKRANCWLRTPSPPSDRAGVRVHGGVRHGDVPKSLFIHGALAAAVGRPNRSGDGYFVAVPISSLQHCQIDLPLSGRGSLFCSGGKQGT